jgi:predicted Fe-Mo cluster-binding NifX family protein
VISWSFSYSNDIWYGNRIHVPVTQSNGASVLNRLIKYMKIAIPVENGRLHSHFGGTTHFAFVEVESNSKTILHSEVLPTPEHQPGAFPRFVRQQGAEVVIAGGIGARAISLFAEQGIKVVAGLPNESIEKLVEAYLNGQLTAAPQGCAHHGDHHHHHDHSHPGQDAC